MSKLNDVTCGEKSFTIELTEGEVRNIELALGNTNDSLLEEEIIIHGIDPMKLANNSVLYRFFRYDLLNGSNHK